MNQPVQCASPSDMAINVQLATLLGWTELETREYSFIGGPAEAFTIGYPPEAQGVTEGIPNWAGDFYDARQLMFRFGISLYLSNDKGVTANIVKLDAPFMSVRHFEAFRDHDTKDEAAARAIARVAIDYLAQKKDIEERAKSEPWPWPKAEDFL